MPHAMSPGKPTTRRYSEAEKDRAVRMVFQLRKELGTEHGR
jgi:transposase